MSVTSSSGQQARGRRDSIEPALLDRPQASESLRQVIHTPGPPGLALLGWEERGRARACPGGRKGSGDLGQREEIGVAQPWLGWRTDLNPRKGLALGDLRDSSAQGRWGVGF